MAVGVLLVVVGAPRRPSHHSFTAHPLWIAIVCLWGCLIHAPHAVFGSSPARHYLAQNWFLQIGVRGGGVTSSLSSSSSPTGGTPRGRQLYNSLTRQSGSKSHFHPVPGHRHLQQLQCRAERRVSKKRKDPSDDNDRSWTSSSSLSHTLRVGLAGGIAGAIGTTALYPFDSAKTLRQSDPAKYKSVRDALWELCRPGANAALTATSRPLTRHSRLGGSSSASASSVPSPSAISAALRRLPGARAYNGWLAATLGAIPSSALYFGAYETMKRVIQSTTAQREDGSTVPSTFASRLLVHAAAAASGNVISSAVFVPKELIKQRMQYSGTSLGVTVWDVVTESGVRGLYRGYQATLMRNIPSAALRFVLYEELKRAWHPPSPPSASDSSSSSHTAVPSFSWRLFAAGAVAGALASGLMTPVDVLKTRLSTGTCPVDVPGCFWHVWGEQGWSGLYAGAGSRMAFSGAFSAIGFASFEAAKTWLGVSDRVPAVVAADAPSSSSSEACRPLRPRRILTDKQSRLEHVLEDNYEEEDN